MNKITNSTFRDARITLDNMHYEKCKFTNCVIEFSGVGNLGLVDCDFDGCQWSFVGPANNTLAFMSDMYHNFGEFGQKMIEATFENIRHSATKNKNGQQEE